MTAVISWVQQVAADRQVEVATVGNEGYLGVPIFLGTDRTPGTSFCQVPGMALKIAVGDFQDMLAAFPRFRRVLNRYVQALLVQIAHGNACNTSHAIEPAVRSLVANDVRSGRDLPVSFDPGISRADAGCSSKRRKCGSPSLFRTRELFSMSGERSRFLIFRRSKGKVASVTAWYAKSSRAC